MPCQWVSGYACPLDSTQCCPVGEWRKYCQNNYAPLASPLAQLSRPPATACCDVDNGCGWAYMCDSECTNDPCPCSQDQDCMGGNTFDENGLIPYCCGGVCTSLNPCPSASPAPMACSGSSCPGSGRHPLGLSVGALAGIIVGAVALLLGCVCFAVIKCRKDASSKKAAAVEMFSQGGEFHPSVQMTGDSTYAPLAEPRGYYAPTIEAARGSA